MPDGVRGATTGPATEWREFTALPKATSGFEPEYTALQRAGCCVDPLARWRSVLLVSAEATQA